MSKFSDMWKVAEAILFDVFNDSILFTPKGGAEVDGNAHLGRVQESEDYDQGGEERTLSRRCNISIGDLTNIASVSINDIVTIDGDIWTVDDIIKKTDTSCKVMLVIVQRINKHDKTHISSM